MSLISSETLADLRTLDTPTVCNALEVVAPDRRTTGFTMEPLVCARPQLPPIVGDARTATIRAQEPDSRPPEDSNKVRMGYYEYVGEGGPKPSVMVIHDLDEIQGFGAWWGEVNSNVHKGLGCAGCVTDGSIRDLDDLAEGFQLLARQVGPSHAHVHLVDYGRPVSVAGMEVADGDLIHADQHGAVVVPGDVAADIRKAADGIARREAVLIEASKEAGFGMDEMRDAFRRMRDIH